MPLSELLWRIGSLFVSGAGAVRCANPLITKYNMAPPETLERRVHNGRLQIELLRGDGGISIWRDVSGREDGST